MTTEPTSQHSPQEQPVCIDTPKRIFTLGLPAPCPGGNLLFPLSPEGAGNIVDRGISVILETGAASSIHYADSAYEGFGVEIADRSRALRADVVACLSTLTPRDVRMMRRGSVLLTLASSLLDSPEAVREMLRHSVTAIAIDRIVDGAGNRPVADTLAEIAGRAAMATAIGFMAEPVDGKGILLGGVAGIVPCEVTVFGSGIAAEAAARSAIGVGATVRMFDDDAYSLRTAVHRLDGRPIASAMHPRVVQNALKSADVVVITPMRRPIHLSSSLTAVMKRRVIVFDLNEACNRQFPSVTEVDLVNMPVPESSNAVSYVNPVNRVPRTAAMALSNIFVTTIDDILALTDAARTVSDAVKLCPALQPAAIVVAGSVVDRVLAEKLQCRCVDLNLLFSLS